MLEWLRNDNEVLWVQNAWLVSAVQTSHVVKFFAFFCFFVAKQYFIDILINIIWQPPFFPLQTQSVLRNALASDKACDFCSRSAHNTEHAYWSKTGDASLFVFSFVKVSPNTFLSNRPYCTCSECTELINKATSGNFRCIHVFPHELDTHFQAHREKLLAPSSQKSQQGYVLQLPLNE